MFSLFFFIGLSLFASSAPALAQAPRAERPTYTTGDKWILTYGVYDLVRIENDLYVFAAAGDREIHLTKDLTIAKVKRGNSVWEFTPPPSISWPLEVGKSGTIFTFWSRPDGGGRLNIEWKVEG